MRNAQINISTGKVTRRATLLFPVALLLLFTACSGKKISSHWQEPGLSIDGVSEDWDPAILQFEDDLKLVYGISNNDNVVRFVVRFNDDRIARKMDMNGFVIWFNKDKNRGIKYVDETARELMHERLLDGPSGPEQFRNRSPEGLRSMLSGTFFLINGEEEMDIQRIPEEHIRAAASIVNGNYGLEYEVPRPILTDDNAFKAGIVICGIDEAVKEAFEKRMSDMRGSRGRQGGMGMDGPSGGRGGMRGGGMRGGGMRSGDRQANLRSDFEKQELWVKVKLADKPESD